MLNFKNYTCFSQVSVMTFYSEWNQLLMSAERYMNGEIKLSPPKLTENLSKHQAPPKCSDNRNEPKSNQT